MMGKLIGGEDAWNRLLFEGIGSRRERESLRRYLPLIRRRSEMGAVCRGINDAALLLYKMKIMDFYRLKSKIFGYNKCSFCHTTARRTADCKFIVWELSSFFLLLTTVSEKRLENAWQVLSRVFCDGYCVGGCIVSNSYLMDHQAYCESYIFAPLSPLYVAIYKLFKIYYHSVQ